MILGVILGFVVLRMCDKAIPPINQEVKESYSIVFCDTNNINTAFGTYGTYDTYETADHIIRMAWNKTKSQKINDGYKIGEYWVVIKKN